MAQLVPDDQTMQPQAGGFSAEQFASNIFPEVEPTELGGMIQKARASGMDDWQIGADAVADRKEAELGRYSTRVKEIEQQFGADERAKVEATQAQKQKSARLFQLLGALNGALAGQNGQQLGQYLDQWNAEIKDDTVGKFERGRKQAYEGLGKEAEAAQLDRREVMQGREDKAYGRAQGLEAQDDDPNSTISRQYQDLGRELGLDKQMKVPLESLSATQLKPLLDPAAKLYQLKNPRTSGLQYGPNDAAYLAEVQNQIIGLVPLGTPIDTEGVSPRALQQGGQLLGAGVGRRNTETRSKRLRGKPLEQMNDATAVMKNVDSIGADLPGWDTGLLKNKVDLVKWYAGLDDPQRAAMRTRLGMNLASYIRAISGLSTTEQERKFLEALVPNANDDEDTLLSKLQEFRNESVRMLGNRLQSYKNADYDVEDFDEQAGARGWLEEVATPATAPGRLPADTKGRATDKPADDMDQAARAIKAAHKAGEITREEALRRLEALESGQ